MSQKVSLYSLSGMQDSLRREDPASFSKTEKSTTNNIQTELKSTLDDHLPIYLSTSTTPSSAPLPRPYRFTPDHTLTYTRLAVGYSAVLLAVYAFYIDYIQHQSFAQQKPYLWIAVPLYFLLNGGLTVYVWIVERGCVFHGTRKATDADVGVKGGRIGLRIDSHAPKRKYEPTYRLDVYVKRGDAAEEKKELNAYFTKFFR